MYISSSDYYNTNKGLIIGRELTEGMALIDDSNQLRIISKIEKNKRFVSEILFQNKMSHIVDMDSYMEDQYNNLKSPFKFKIGEYAVFKFNNIIKRKENLNIDWDNLKNLKANALPVYIPVKNSEELSLWLGIVLARGVRSKDGISLQTRADEDWLGDLFVFLTKKVFNITPECRQCGEGKQFYFFSRNVVNFLKKQMGAKKTLERIPNIIKNASPVEQLAFIKGLSSKGYMESGYPVLYSGTSIAVINFICSVMYIYGYIPSVRTKKGYLNQVHYVTIFGSYSNEYDLLKNLAKQKKDKYKVFFLDKIKYFKKHNLKLNERRNIMTYKKQNICPASKLKDYNLVGDDHRFLLKIDAIKKMEKEMLKISFQDQEKITIISNGLKISEKHKNSDLSIYHNEVNNETV